MRIILQISLIVFSSFLLLACNKEAKPIDYGNDGCHFCKMTIVDKTYGSELITDKGKVFKFDAAECMINFLNENKDLPTAKLLTNYYEEPTKFITVEGATFLISENLPSPMGANLTAFKTKESAEKVLADKGGDLYTWEELRAHFNN